MAELPPFRTGYISLLLPSSVGDEEIKPTIRKMVTDALTANGEWPVRVEIVTSKRVGDGSVRRWFVEYETGPYGEVID